MGIIEEVLARVSAGGLAIGLVVSFVLYAAVSRINTNMRINKLGQRAPHVHHKLPFGKSVYLHPLFVADMQLSRSRLCEKGSSRNHGTQEL